MDAAAFDRLIDQLRTVDTRSEIILEEVPAPQKLAKFSFAFSADVSNGLTGDAKMALARAALFCCTNQVAKKLGNLIFAA